MTAEKKFVPKESTIVKNIQRYLETIDGVHVEKTHGGQWGNAGKPDLIGSYQGRAFAFEVKRPGKEHTLTARQKRSLKEWERAGAVVGVVTAVDQVRDIITELAADIALDQWDRNILRNLDKYYDRRGQTEYFSDLIERAEKETDREEKLEAKFKAKMEKKRKQ